MLVKANVDFLNEPVIVTITDLSVTIKRSGLCYSGKTIKLSPKKNEWFQTTFQKIIPLGKLQIDSEYSNEDEIVAYF